MFPMKGCAINIARSKAPSAVLPWILLYTSETSKTLPLHSVTWKSINGETGPWLGRRKSHSQFGDRAEKFWAEQKCRINCRCTNESNLPHRKLNIFRGKILCFYAEFETFILLICLISLVVNIEILITLLQLFSIISRHLWFISVILYFTNYQVP